MTVVQGTEEVEIHNYRSKTESGASFSARDLTTCAEPIAANTISESSHTSSANDQEHTVDDSGRRETCNPVAHASGLTTEELSVVNSALEKLRTPLRSGCTTTVHAGIPQQEVWKLVLDEEWRAAGIRGE